MLPCTPARFTFIAASLTAASTMTPMTTVPEQVHRDEGDTDHNPEPICRQPFHDFSPFGFLSVNSGLTANHS
jgi:hypothetical protein